MFLGLKKSSTFPCVKTTVDTLIDVRNETSKHHLLQSGPGCLESRLTLTQS